MLVSTKEALAESLYAMQDATNCIRDARLERGCLTSNPLLADRDAREQRIANLLAVAHTKIILALFVLEPPIPPPTTMLKGGE